MEGEKKPCPCPHHKCIPALIILFGLLFLLGELKILSTSVVSIGWPILVILAGLAKFGQDKCKCC